MTTHECILIGRYGKKPFPPAKLVRLLSNGGPSNVFLLKGLLYFHWDNLSEPNDIRSRVIHALSGGGPEGPLKEWAKTKVDDPCVRKGEGLGKWSD